MEDPKSPDSTLETGLAIIGMACRFPGAEDLAAYWKNLEEGTESITFFSIEELEAAGVEPARIRREGFVRAGAVLPDVELFDADFFGFSPREAEVMDPQHRLFLELAWQALEDAGYDPGSYPHPIGVFAGTGLSTYLLSHIHPNRHRLAPLDDLQVLMLNDKDFLPTRLSYKLNLRGPSVNVQTACSTSLVAVHQACQSLLNGECDIALAGGVSIRLPQKTGYLYREGMIASPDGHCRAFDERARGTLGGNGAGVVVLRPLIDALEAGDHVYAVVRGSAINNDGALKVSFSAPAVDGQATVISEALAVAGVEAETIGYVEAHGTGTELGDPIEIAALTQAYRESTAARGFCAIGSVKTNIGHLDAAAGVAGLIKTALTLEHGKIPPSLHFETPNPKIDFDNSPFYVNTRLTPWQRDGHPRRAGVSSFGMGGTNAHVILEEAPAPEPPSASERPCQLLLLSARSEAALDVATGRLAAYLEAHPERALEDVSHTLSQGRRSFSHRRAVVCRDREEAIAALGSRDPRRVASGFRDPAAPHRPVAFLLPGQGAQVAGMGCQLAAAEPTFAAVLERAAELLRDEAGCDLADALRDADGEDARIHRTALAQPALFAVEVALARLWMEWGIAPEAMLGHSLGEYVAAHLAGVFTFEEGLRLVAARGRLMQELPAGAMLAVKRPEDEIAALLADGFPELSVAAVNAPGSVVVSGPTEPIDRLQEDLAGRSVEHRRLDVSHAFHSAMMEPVIETFGAELAKVAWKAPERPYLSNLTGGWITAAEATDPSYWLRHLRQPVRFGAGLSRLLERLPDAVLLEVGPGRGLSSLVRQQETSPERGETPAYEVHGSLPRDRRRSPEPEALLATLGRLWLAGVEVDWRGFWSHERRRRVPLPTYPFERRRYWVEAGRTAVAADADGKKAEPAEWFYLPSWKQAPAPADLGRQPSPWLLFLPEDGAGRKLGEEMARLVADGGEGVVTVTPGAGFERRPRGFVLDPGRAEHYRELLAALAADGEMPRTILHLWNLSGAGAGRPLPAGPQAFAAAQRLGYDSLLFLGRALAAAPASDRLRLMVVADGLAQVSSGEPLDPAKATLLGPLDVLAQEHPRITCGHVDVSAPSDGAAREELAGRLLAEARAVTPEPAVAWRGRRRWIRSFEPIRLEAEAAGVRRLRPRGVYLIVGGLGRLGLVIAEFLARTVAARLVLLGRSEMPERAAWERLAREGEDELAGTLRRLLELEASGAEVLVLAADVADRDAMRRAFEQCEERFGELHGVVHAAMGGRLTTPLAEITPELSRSHFRSKVDGLFVLDELLAERSVDFCCVFSSLASLLGGLGLTAYAAANRFVDAFVAARQDSGLARPGLAPWISIDWDGWAVGAEGAESRGTEGVTRYALTAAEGTEAFRRVVTQVGDGQIAVSTGDLTRRFDRWVRRRDEPPADGGGRPEPAAPAAAARRGGVPYAAPRNSLEQTLADIFSQVLGIDAVGIHDDFFELGGHSLLAIQISSRIRQAAGFELPVRILFETPTVAELAERVAAEPAAAPAPTALPLVPLPRDPSGERGLHGELPLSFAQQRLWFLDQLDPGNAAYNFPAAFRLSGETRPAALAAALRRVVERHEALRTTFPSVDGRPVERIAAPAPVPLPVVDLGRLSGGQAEQEARRLARGEAERPFDLARGPMLQVRLLRLGSADHVLLLLSHHIVIDGSMDLLVEELVELYRALVSGRPPVLPRLELQYADFAHWQRQWLTGEVLETQLAYWKSRLAGERPVLELPLDRPRPAFQTTRGRRLSLRFPAEVTRGTRTLAREHDATLFIVLLAAFDVLLYRYSGQTRLSVGSTSADRPRLELERMIGCFINTLVLDADLSGRPTFAEVLEQVRSSTLDAYSHKDLPFELLVEALDLPRDLSHNPLFQVMLVVREEVTETVDLPGLVLRPYGARIKTARFDWLVSLWPDAEDLVGMVEYNADLFDETTVHRMTEHFRVLLGDLAERPQARLGDLRLLTAGERHQLLREWNDTARAASGDRLLHQPFEERAASSGDALAVAAGDASWSYRRLDRRANQIAHLLRSRGVGRQDPVGVYMERSPEMIAAILAVLKAGGTYVPLDADLPPERAAWILARLGIRHLLTWRTDLGAAAGAVPDLEHRLDLDGAQAAEVDRQPPHGLPAVAGGGDLAYVIFTSGSTGGPKGVAVCHRAASNLVEWVNREFDVGPDDRLLFLTSVGFDLSVYDVFGILAAGGCVRLVSRQTGRDPERLLQILSEEPITFWDSAPAACQQLVPFLPAGRPSRLRRVFLSGDWIPVALPDQLRAAFPGTRVISLGGATEATVWSNVFAIAEVDPRWASIPYGRPIQNARYHVLDGELRPCPAGVAGDLYIAGGCLASAYAREPALTAQKFLPDPFAGAEGGRLYATGDRARAFQDGNLEFLGRLDHQVKIRGYRVELGEIEGVLTEHPAIREAVVLARRDQPGSERLCAYLIADDGVLDDLESLRRFLRRQLPDYMVPAAFVGLDAWPLTANGKLDRKALPAPEAAAGGDGFVAPRSPLEKAVAGVWAEVLRRERVGVEDSFFDLGGHSLNAAELVHKLRETFEVELSLRRLFETPTVAGLAEALAEQGVEAPGSAARAPVLPAIVPAPDERGEPFPLTEIQQAYWVGRQGDFQLGNVSAHLYLELEVLKLDLGRFENAVRRLIERHDMLRAVVSADGRQRILPRVPPYDVVCQDLTALAPADAEAELARVRRRLSHQVLASDRWPLFELHACRLDRRRTHLHVSLDVLLADAWSLQVLVADLLAFYRDPGLAMAPLELSFRDYVQTLVALRESELYRRAEAYWAARLPELPPAPELPLAKAPAAVARPRFERWSGRLEPEVWERLRGNARKAGLTASGALLAAFAEVLRTWSKSPRFTINLTLFNRLPLHPEVPRLVGDFTSATLLAVESTASGETFEQRARRLQQRLWEDLDHTLVSGVHVLRELARIRRAGSAVMMPVVFTSGLDLDAGGGAGAETPGDGPPALRCRQVYNITQTPQVWLDHQVGEHQGALFFNWDVVAELFPAGLVDDMFGAYRALLERLAGDEEVWQSVDPELVPAPQMALRRRVNDTSTAVPAGLLHDGFLAQAAARPDALAVISPERRLTYGELRDRSRHVAHLLRRRGVQPNELVAVVTEKGWQQVVAVLAVLQAGAAYLPVDPDWPYERRRYVLQQGRVRWALTRHPWAEDGEWPTGVEPLSLDVEDAVASAETPALEPIQEPTDLAYVIFTSGSTGRPKGVMIDHRGALNTVADVNRRFAVGPGDRVLALSALSFDLSVYDVFGPLAAGGAVVLPDPAARRDPAHWAELMNTHAVSVWNSVPAFMEMLAEYLEARPERVPETLRLVLLSGDWIPLRLPERIRALTAAARVISLGGATEASIWSIFHPVEDVAADWKSIPYGRPLANQSFHVLNELFEPCPEWVVGQLYIGGIGLAQGYWRDEEKTRASFVVHPRTGERLYRTGDLGRYLPSGEIEFLGREDFQVKVRGYRIELGEIETALRHHPAVAEAVAAVAGDPRGERWIVAYVVFAAGRHATGEELAGSLEAQLPVYMVPSRFVILRELPLTANGKVDRRALPPPEDVETQAASAAPRPDDQVVAKIGALVASILGLASVDPDVDLLTLGLNSLQMVRVSNLLESELGFRPPIEDFYAAPRVTALARAYQESLGTGAPPAPARRTPPAPAAGAEAFELLLDPDERTAFKNRHPGLRRDLGELPSVALPAVAESACIEARWAARRSHREFSPEAIRPEQLGELLAVLKALPAGGGLKYFYPSAGSLYPVQCYLHSKADRVAGLEAGLYYYDPLGHRLVALAPGLEIPRAVHEPFVNRPIFDQAAFSLFLVGRLSAIAPIYGPMSRDFCLLEAGAMLQALMEAAPACELGLCPIGSIDFEPVRDHFDLEQHDLLVHSLLGGRIDARDRPLEEPSAAIPRLSREGEEREEFEF